MNYGLYLSATAVLSNMHRQDVLTNNLSNVETIGFKPSIVETRERLPERLESSTTFSDPRWMLENLGGGHLVNPTRLSMKQGSLNNTDRPMDIAFEGDGFFVVKSGSGELALTRDGRLTIDDDGFLVHAATGAQILDEQLGPVRMAGGGQLRVDDDGTVARDGTPFSKLKLVSAQSSSLRTKGGNLLAHEGNIAGLPNPSGRIRQGWVETSAVDPISTLTDLISATKAIQASAKLMQYHDNLMGQAINRFARVS